MNTIDEALAAIKARCEAAPPGPWWKADHGMMCNGPDVWPQNWLCDLTIAQSELRAFILASRTDLPCALAALEVAVKALEEIRENTERPSAWFAGRSLAEIQKLLQ